MQTRKHDDSWGRGVPALNRVGLACVNQRWLMRWYVSMAASMSSLWMPTATRMSMCCGRSTTRPFTRSRYDRSRVCGRGAGRRLACEAKWVLVHLETVGGQVPGLEVGGGGGAKPLVWCRERRVGVCCAKGMAGTKD